MRRLGTFKFNPRHVFHFNVKIVWRFEWYILLGNVAAIFQNDFSLKVDFSRIFGLKVAKLRPLEHLR